MGDTIIDNRYVVIRDTREKENHGWFFPATSSCAGTEENTLKTGDYTLKGAEHLLCIERKGGIAEFAANVNQERFERELQRMIVFPFAYLLLEFDMFKLFHYPAGSGIPKAKQRFIKVRGPYLLKRYLEICINYPNIHIILCGDSGREIASSIFKRVIEKINGGPSREDTISD